MPPARHRAARSLHRAAAWCGAARLVAIGGSAREMLSTQAFWWLALPVLLLPIWWHRQKRQRLKAEPLATARFLPSSAPEQLRVWQWSDRLLLLARCLLLVALIAWLAVTVFPWRGDTVLLDAGVDKTWADEQIRSAGFTAAAREPMPVDVLPWLHSHEHEWRGDARLLIVGAADKIAMPARPPQFAHAVTLRVKAPVVAGVVQKSEHHIVLATTPDRAQAWHALFNAFGVAGGGNERYVMTDTPDSKTELIVWDMRDAAAPANWRAPLWWATPNALPEQTATRTVGIFQRQRLDAEICRQCAWPSV